MAGRKSDHNFDIPIKQTDLAVLDDALTCMKEKFIAEIKRMDDEMNKFSSDLMKMNAPCSSSQHSGVVSAQDSSGCPSPSKCQPPPPCPPNTLKLQFDVSQFDPEEVNVKVKNETLFISASHEEKNDCSKLMRQYHREFKLPEGVDPCSVSSTLSKDGILTVQAELPPSVCEKSSRCSS